MNKELIAEVVASVGREEVRGWASNKPRRDTVVGEVCKSGDCPLANCIKDLHGLPISVGHKRITAGYPPNGVVLVCTPFQTAFVDTIDQLPHSSRNRADDQVTASDVLMVLDELTDEQVEKINSRWKL